MIVLKNLSFTFPRQAVPALHAIDLILKEGQSWAIVGPDGAGKTTLLRLLVGVLRPTSGTGSVLGFSLQSPLPSKFFENIGYLPQKLGLYEDLSVSQQIALYGSLQNCKGKEIQPWVNELLELTQLASFPNRLTSDLSGGMRQKLALICALIHRPKLLILDEPTVGVDIKARYEIWKILEKLQSQGLTLIWSTADCEEAQKCQNVLFLNNGKIQLQSTPQECLKLVSNQIYAQPLRFTPHENWRQKFLQASYSLHFQSLLVNPQGLRARENPEAPLDSDTKNEWNLVPETFEDAFLSLYVKRTNRPHFTQPQGSLSLIALHDETLLSVKQISKNFGSFIAVQPLTFELQCGEILGLLGPNGCGKSTTFKMLCGLLSPTSGSVTLWGQDVSLRTARSIHNRIGYMPQKFALYRPLTLLQNLTFFAGLYGLSSKQAQAQISEIIDLLDLRDYQEETLERLPLGLLQKVSFACALVHQPEILFLDEPTSGVDPMTRQEFWKILLEVNQSGVSIVITTHFLEEAQYCHKILLMNQGCNIALGSPLELFHNARKNHPHVHTMGELFLWYLSQPLEMPL